MSIKKKRFLIIFFINLFIMMVGATFVAFASNQPETTTQENTIEKKDSSSDLGKFIGAGLAIAGATIGSGIAVGRVGSAAMGAISEKPETTGISLVFVALAEGISLWGFLVAFFILQK